MPTVLVTSLYSPRLSSVTLSEPPHLVKKKTGPFCLFFIPILSKALPPAGQLSPGLASSCALPRTTHNNPNTFTIDTKKKKRKRGNAKGFFYCVCVCVCIDILFFFPLVERRRKTLLYILFFFKNSLISPRWTEISYPGPAASVYVSTDYITLSLCVCHKWQISFFFFFSSFFVSDFNLWWKK